MSVCVVCTQARLDELASQGLSYLSEDVFEECLIDVYSTQEVCVGVVFGLGCGTHTHTHTTPLAPPLCTCWPGLQAYHAPQCGVEQGWARYAHACACVRMCRCVCVCPHVQPELASFDNHAIIDITSVDKEQEPGGYMGALAVPDALALDTYNSAQDSYANAGMKGVRKVRVLDPSYTHTHTHTHTLKDTHIEPT